VPGSFPGHRRSDSAPFMPAIPERLGRQVIRSANHPAWGRFLSLQIVARGVCSECLTPER